MFDHEQLIENRDLKKEEASLKKKLKGLKREFVRLKSSFKKYELFFEDKKITNLALLESFFFILRRTVFILSALYLIKQSLVILAVAIFSVSSFLRLTYMLSAKPMIQPQRNYIEAMNEIFVLVSAYFALLLLNESQTREEIYNLGRAIKTTIYTSVAFNVIIICVSFYLQTKTKCRLFCLKKCNKKAYKNFKNAKKLRKKKKKQEQDMESDQDF